MLTPLERYRRDVAAGRICPDPAQAQAAGALDRLHRELAADGGPTRADSAHGWLRRVIAPGRRCAPRGVYLWGGVGRGKTRLMNLFYEELPLAAKLRVHFHHFMRDLHGQLRELRSVTDPLPLVAKRLAARARVICLDEFHVVDITDAMLLGRLLEGLLGIGVTLVATSNEAPRELYRDGLQRERFLPAIALLEEHTEVVHVAGELDYRLRALARAGVYHRPLDATAHQHLLESFEEIAPEVVSDAPALDVLGRAVPVVRSAEGIAWFEFADLCGGPRAAVDYIEIARSHHTVLIANIPRMDDGDIDRVARFIHLVDELYDRSVNLIVSAAAAPNRLYAGRRLQGPFQRTCSRLVEMQSRAYLARAHRA